MTNTIVKRVSKKVTTQVVSFEGDGDYAMPNMLVQPEALWWNTDETIFVVDSYDVSLAEARPVGKVINIERRDDHLIVATIAWSDEKEIYTNSTIYAKDVVWDEEAQKKNPELKWAAKYARIRAVIVGDKMPWIELNEKGLRA